MCAHENDKKNAIRSNAIEQAVQRAQRFGMVSVNPTTLYKLIQH